MIEDINQGWKKPDNTTAPGTDDEPNVYVREIMEQSGYHFRVVWHYLTQQGVTADYYDNAHDCVVSYGKTSKISGADPRVEIYNKSLKAWVRYPMT